MFQVSYEKYGTLSLNHKMSMFEKNQREAKLSVCPKGTKVGEFFPETKSSNLQVMNSQSLILNQIIFNGNFWIVVEKPLVQYFSNNFFDI